MYVLDQGALLKTKCWRVFSEEALSINSAHTSAQRGCFSPYSFCMPIGRWSSHAEIQTTHDNCCCTIFLNVFVFCYRINLSEEQTIDIAMIEQLREAVDLLQDTNRYAYNS